MLRSVIFILVFFITSTLLAQEYTLKGVIQCFESIPLVKAEVEVKGTKEFVKTDKDGKFTVLVKPKDRIKVSANGFYTTKVTLEPGVKMLAINMKLKPGKKGKAYAIGFGHVLDEEKLNAVAQLNNEELDFSQYSSMYELIQGRFTGVQISGGDIIIRGESSLLGSNAAMIVVDGMPTYSGILSSISPADVKNINVLKGSAAAIYGVRGAAGVVVIETKTGRDE